MATTTERKYSAVIFDFFGVLTFNMVEVISYFEDREKLPRGTLLRAWADPRGQDLFRLRGSALLGQGSDRSIHAVIRNSSNSVWTSRGGR
jgi:hypothetical protein